MVAVPPMALGNDDGAPEAAERVRVDVAFLGVERELPPGPPDVRRPVDAVRLDDEDPPDLVPVEPRFAVAFLPVLLPELLFAVLLFAELLFAVVLLLGLLFAVLLEPLFAVVLLLELRFLLGLLFAVLLEPRVAVLRFEVLLEPLFAVVLLLELRFEVLLELARFVPLRFRGELAPPPSESASMSSSFRIREAPLIPARVARFRSSTTVMSSMLRATSAPSPICPLTCAVATPERPTLITRPRAAR